MHQLHQLAASARLQAELTRVGGAALVHVLRHACAALVRATNEAAGEDEASAAWLHVEQLATEAYERSWEKLHCGEWKSVASEWRETFALAGVLRVLGLQRKGALLECMRILDMCLMMAGPYALRQTHGLIAQVEAQLLRDAHPVSPNEAAKLREETRGGLESQAQPAKKLRIATAEYERAIAFPIRRLHFPSLEEFRQRVLLQNEPVIITGAMEHWPALGRADPSRAWRDASYFRCVAGWRTVPIEIGSSYLADEWKQELMTVNEFIDRYIEVPDDAPQDHERVVGYLAQHHLFEQIPVLGRDILIPDYCALRRSEDDDEDEDIAVNAWFGPKGTVSPLHFDPKDNLLCQAVGAKYLRLYAPEESDKLYPVEGLLSNTSQVQVHLPETHAQFPEFRRAKYVECVLKEGEMLFIPPRYWHFVESLSTSFSVSFWWS